MPPSGSRAPRRSRPAGAPVASNEIVPPLDLAALVESIGIPITAYDLEGAIQTWNAAAEALFGYTAAEMVGTRDGGRIVPPARRAEARDLFDRARAGESTGTLQTQRQRKDGSLVDLLLSGSPLRTPAGEVIGVALVGVDVSARVQGERAMRDERDRLDTIVASMGEGVIVTNAARRVVLMNRAAEQMVGASRQAVLGRELGETPLPITAAELAAPGSPTPLLKPWGSRTLSIIVTPLRDTRGRQAGAVSLLRDVTELTQVDRMKSEFISVVSHELRTPLTSIKGYTDLVLEGDAGELDPEQREYLQIVKNSADRLVALINDLLDISRIEGGGLRLLCRPIDLPALLAEVARSFRPQLEERGQRFTLALPAGLPRVLADHDRLLQVLQNLVSNAVKYSPPGSSITVSTAPRRAEYETAAGEELRRRQAPLLAISVADEGIGIAPDDQLKLFEKFYRVDNSLTRKEGGTGLGLAIVKRFVELHGGRVWVTSPTQPARAGQPAHGSTFTFTLPLAEE